MFKKLFNWMSGSLKSGTPKVTETRIREVNDYILSNYLRYINQGILTVRDNPKSQSLSDCLHLLHTINGINRIRSTYFCVKFCTTEFILPGGIVKFGFEFLKPNRGFEFNYDNKAIHSSTIHPEFIGHCYNVIKRFEFQRETVRYGPSPLERAYVEWYSSDRDEVVNIC